MIVAQQKSWVILFNWINIGGSLRAIWLQSKYCYWILCTCNGQGNDNTPSPCLPIPRFAKQPRSISCLLQHRCMRGQGVIQARPCWYSYSPIPRNPLSAQPRVTLTLLDNSSAAAGGVCSTTGCCGRCLAGTSPALHRTAQRRGATSPSLSQHLLTKQVKKKKKLTALAAIASGTVLPAQAQIARKTTLFLV